MRFWGYFVRTRRLVRPQKPIRPQIAAPAPPPGRRHGAASGGPGPAQCSIVTSPQHDAVGSRPRDFAGLLALEPHGPDTFVGVSAPYIWGRIYGGQVIAQALYAAAMTVPEARAVHSLHACFILGGRLDEPVRYEVDRVRNGRSFMTRRVVARQSY